MHIVSRSHWWMIRLDGIMCNRADSMLVCCDSDAKLKNFFLNKLIHSLNLSSKWRFQFYLNFIRLSTIETMLRLSDDLLVIYLILLSFFFHIIFCQMRICQTNTFINISFHLLDSCNLTPVERITLKPFPIKFFVHSILFASKLFFHWILNIFFRCFKVENKKISDKSQ